MARGVNKVFLIGNLGRDAELSFTPGGLAITKFSLATSENRKNQEGEWTEKTEWHRIVIFGDTGERINEYLKKGRQVFIEGRISYGSYEREGVKTYTTDIIANNVQLLGSRDESAPPRTDGSSRSREGRHYEPDQSPPDREPGNSGDDDENLPF